MGGARDETARVVEDDERGRESPEAGGAVSALGPSTVLVYRRLEGEAQWRQEGRCEVGLTVYKKSEHLPPHPAGQDAGSASATVDAIVLLRGAEKGRARPLLELPCGGGRIRGQSGMGRWCEVDDGRTSTIEEIGARTPEDGDCAGHMRDGRESGPVSDSQGRKQYGAKYYSSAANRAKRPVQAELAAVQRPSMKHNKCDRGGGRGGKGGKRGRRVHGPLQQEKTRRSRRASRRWRRK